MTVRVSMLLKSRTSLTFFEACFLPIWAKDLSAPQYTILRRFKRFLHHAKRNYLSATFSNGLLSVFILWIRLAFWSRDMTMYLILSQLLYGPVSLLATIKVSAFSCTVRSLPPTLFTSSTQTRKWSVPFHMKPFWFTWILLMAYSKAKLKNNGDGTSHSFKQILIGNMSDIFLPMK